MFHLLYLILVFFIFCARSENVENTYELGPFGKRLHEIISINNITNSTCAFDILDSIDAMSRSEVWAIKMFDASSKMQSGFAMGNIVNMGSFDECISVKGKIEDRDIKGKYCVFGLFFTKLIRPDITYGIPNVLKEMGEKNPGLPIIESICVPDSCNSEELTDIFNNSGITDILSVKPAFNDFFCQVEDETPLEFTMLHYITLFFIFGDIFLIIVCTAYDLYLQSTEKKPLLQIMISFSLYTNIKQLTTIKKDPDQLPCINGIRTLSIFWVVLGHKFLFTVVYPHVNYLYIFKWLQEDTTSLITGALFSVDTFFVISGLLVMYVVLLAKEKNFKFSIIHYYLHRIFRLSPALIMIILYFMTFAKHFGSGPFQPLMYNILEEPCEKYWWATLLYLQNTVDTRDICVQQTWYLAVDTQLYVLAPLLFIPIQKWPKITLYVIVGLITISCFSAFIITWNLQLSASYLAIGGAYKSVYGSTLVRSNAWLIGSLLGYFLFIKRGKRVIIPKSIVALLWILTIAVMTSIIYMQAYFNRTDYNRLTACLYHALSKPFWSLSVSWVIFACVHGYGGFVSKFLSSKVFIILGRLTYTMFLLHIYVIYLNIVSERQPTDFSNVNTVHGCIADILYVIGLSAVWSLMFESPIICLGKALMPQKMADQLKKINEDNEIVHQQQNNNRHVITRL